MGCVGVWFVGGFWVTPGRRQKLEAAMPDEVQLTERTVYGQKVVTVSEADMDQWCADAGIK